MNPDPLCDATHAFNPSHIINSSKLLDHPPLLSIYYLISSTQRLLIVISNDMQRTYLETLTGTSVVHQLEVSLASPFDLRLLLQRIPHNHIPSFFYNNFTVRLSKGVYTLFPLLKGGGGALTTCTGPPQKKRQMNTYPETERQPLEGEINLKKQDIKTFYLPERDGHPGSAMVGPFYQKLVDQVFDKIERESRDKLKLSNKIFRIYLSSEIQIEEAKMLRVRFEESLKNNNKSLKEILLYLVSFLRTELYPRPAVKAVSEDVIAEQLSQYEEKIMIRLIRNTLLRSVNPYIDESEDFESKVAKKLLKYAKYMIRLRHESQDQNNFSTPIRKQGIADTANISSKATKYKRLLSLPYGEAIKQAQLHVLRGLAWNKYSASLLVKHYNLIIDSKEPIDERNRAIMEEIASNMLISYQEKEDSLTPAEINELVGLGGIKHKPADSKERTLFQRLLSQFATDINNDLVFDSLKTQALATIIFQHSNSEEESSRIDDDLKQCMDVLHRQVERRLFTAENQNMQDCMDALNLVLYTMANRNVTGLRNDKEMAQLAATFRDQLPSLAKNAFSFVFKNQHDPGLRIKASYAQEALKRIGTADANLSNLEVAILQAAPAVVGIVSGVFSFDAGSVIDGLKTLISTGLGLYASFEKSWYDEVNKVYFLANMEFEEFEKRYFTPSSKVGITGEELTYFICKELYKIARTTSRVYTERKKMIEWLGDIYEAKTIKGEKLNHFAIFRKQDIKAYIQKCLSDLARMPQEENLPFNLAEDAKKVLGRLGLEPIKQDIPFEFVQHSISNTNSLLLHALKSSMTLEYVFSVMYSNCTAYYEKEIRHLNYIEIEGQKYINKTKTSKREPLWSSSASHALTTFLTSPEYPVLLIQGDAGTGKSTFLKIIEYQQWKSHQQGLSDYIPIFIRLSEILNPAKCLAETFQGLHFSHRVLEQLKDEGSKRKYLFIFDGYDELKAPKNLYEVNKLFEYGKNVKVIISSREEYLKGYGNYVKYFRPKACGDLLEYRITSLSERQRRIYLARKALQNKKIYDHTNDKALKRQLQDWITVENYIDAIKKIPGLEDFIKTPYMLTIITDILPSLDSDSKSRVTKANIYKVFTMKYFEVEMNRILENSRDTLPKGLDLEKSFYEFAKDLALNLYLTDRTSVKTEASNYVVDYDKAQPQKQEIIPEQTKGDDGQRFARFFSEDAKVKLARSGVPITMMDGQVRFNHKSIMEYFAARCFYDELKFCPVDALHKRSLSWRLLKGGSQIHQESDVLNFLKEMIADNDFKQTTLNEKVDTEDNLSHNIASPDLHPQWEWESSSPIKLSTKFASTWKSGSPGYKSSKNHEEPKLLYIQEVQTSTGQGPDIDQEQEEGKSGVHVLEKLKEAIKSRSENEITNPFFVNVLMIMSSLDPDIVELLTMKEMNKLNQFSNTCKEFKDFFVLAFAKYLYTRQKSETSVHSDVYSEQYLASKLNGDYKGEKVRDPEKRWILYAHGQGEISYDNGDFYSGSWVKDKKQGYGEYTFAKHETYKVYIGYWKDDTFDGEGKMKYVDRSIYFGHWKEGVQEGWGEYTQYAIENDNLVAVEVYKGQWSQGQKHGSGSIYLGDQTYHGIWNQGILLSGELEFANGAKIPGTFSEKEGFKPYADKIRFDHDYSIKVANTYAFVLQRVGQFSSKLKKENNRQPVFGKELLIQDSDGNSPVLLYCRNVGSRALNEMMPHFLGAVVAEPSHANKRGENMIHMLVCNKKISIQFKNNLLDKLKESQPKFYLNSITPTKKESGEVPLLYAIDHLGMLKIRTNTANFTQLKLLLIQKLTPLENTSRYISKQLEDANIDLMTLALLEFDSRANDDLYLGPASSIKPISLEINKLSDRILIALIARNENELLLKLIKDKFFYIYGKNLRLILLNSLEIMVGKKPLDQVFIEIYGEALFEAPVFKITESLIDALPASAINTTFKEDKKIILKEYSKFLQKLTLEYFGRHISEPVSKEICIQLLTRPLFEKVLRIALKDLETWEALCSWLSTRFRASVQGEEKIYEIIEFLMDSYSSILGKEKLIHLVIRLATPGKTGIYHSPKYWYKMFVKYFIPYKSSLGKELETYHTYKWFQNYFEFARSTVKKRTFNPKDFQFKGLARLILRDAIKVFKPLIAQSLVVAAIEMQDSELAIELIQICDQWIQKLHYWKTVWIHDSTFFETLDSTKPWFGKEDRKDKESKFSEEFYIKIRKTEKNQDGQDMVDEFSYLDKKYKYRFYNDQPYFLGKDICNVMLVSEGSEIVVKEGVAIVEMPEGYHQSVCFSPKRGFSSKLFECITHESMHQVLRMLVHKSVDIIGLDQYIIEDSDSETKINKLALSLFFKSDYLLYSKLKVTAEVNYQDTVKDYVVGQYTQAFCNGIPPFSVLAQPNIVQIVNSFLKSPSDCYRFFGSTINRIMLDSRVKLCSKNKALFFQEVLSSLQDYLLPVDYTQLCCDVYQRLTGVSGRFFKHDKTNQTSDKTEPVNLKLEALKTELQAQKKSEEKMAESLERYKDAIESITAAKLRIQEGEDIRSKCAKDAEALLSSFTGGNLSEIDSLSSSSSVFGKILTAMFSILDEKETTFARLRVLLEDHPRFLERLRSFTDDPDRICRHLCKVEDVEKILEGVTEDEAMTESYVSGVFFKWIKIVLKSDKHLMMIKELKPELQTLENTILELKTEVQSVGCIVETLPDEIQYLEEMVEEENESDSSDTNRSNYYTKETVLGQDDSLLKFFSDLVCKNLPNLSSREATKFLFESIERFLKRSPEYNIKLLANTIIADKINLENLTPFAMLIYEKLLALAIKYELPELALGLLTKFQGRLQRVKAWTVKFKKNEYESEDGSGSGSEDRDEDKQETSLAKKIEFMIASKDCPAHIKEDKLKDLKSRDKRLEYFEYGSKIAVLIPTATDIERKTSITRNTKDIVMVVEEENDYILDRLARDNMKDVLKLIAKLDIYVGDFESIINKEIVDPKPRCKDSPYSWGSTNSRSICWDFGLLCRLSTRNYLLGKRVEDRLKSPDEWDCKNYKDYLWLLLNHPDAGKNPVEWLLKPDNKRRNVLKRIMQSLSSKENAEHFFNNFVAQYTKDPIKVTEEVLLTKVIEKSLGIIFITYLKLINSHPDVQNRFSYVYQNCILENLDTTMAQEFLLHLQEFPESWPDLDQFVTQTLEKVEGYTDLFYHQLVIQLLNGYLSGRKTTDQVKRWIKLLFANSNTFVGAGCSDQELFETLIYNLLKSLIIVSNKDMEAKNQLINKQFSQVSSLFDTIMECMGLKVSMPPNGRFKLAKSNIDPFITGSRLAVFYRKLLELLESNTLILPNASTCQGYDKFISNTGINIPSNTDVLSFIMINVQVAMHLELVQELESKLFEKQASGPSDFETHFEFAESPSEVIPPLQYSIKNGEKLVLCSYYVDSSQKLPSASLFRTNTNNLDQVKSALFPERVLQLYDPTLVSLQCLHDSLLAIAAEKKLQASFQQNLPHFGLFSQQESTAMLTEKLIYNSLYCLCLTSERPVPEEKLSQVFTKAKGGIAPLFDLVLNLLGIEIQFESLGIVIIKQVQTPLCSSKDMLRLTKSLADLVFTTAESCSKMTHQNAEHCVGYQIMKEKLGLSLPEDMTALNFCSFSILLALRVSSFLATTGLATDNLDCQDKRSLKVRLIPVKGMFPRAYDLLSSPEVVNLLYYKIRKLKSTHAAYNLDITLFPSIEEQGQYISRGTSQTPQYFMFSRSFLNEYCGNRKHITNVSALFKSIIYHHEELVSRKPEQLEKIRLLEHIIGIFLTVFRLTDAVGKQVENSLDSLITRKIKHYFLDDKDITPLNFLKLIITALGYDLKLNDTSQTMALSRIGEPICSMKELLNVRAFLLDIKRINKIEAPPASNFPGYKLFESTTGFSVPENCDIFSLYIFLIDLVQSLALVEDLCNQDYTVVEETERLRTYPYKLKFVLQPEGQLQKMNLVEEEGDKIVSVHYRMRSTKEWPGGHLLEINDSNYDELRKHKSETQKRNEESKSKYVPASQKFPSLQKIFLELWKPSEKLEKAVEFETH